MSLLDFIVLTLAAAGLVDVWKNGSIFADWRAFLQDKADEPPTSPKLPGTDDTDDDTFDADEGEKLPFLMRVADKVIPPVIADLLSCSFCFSHHTPYILALLCFLPAQFVTTGWIIFLLKLPAYSLAATRAGTLLNAMIPEDARYDR